MNAHVTVLLQNQPLAAAACSSYFLTVPMEAPALLRQVPTTTPTDAVTRSLLLALAERQLDNRNAARLALAEAKRLLAELALRAGLLRLSPHGVWASLAATAATPPTPWEEKLEIRLLLAEAEAAVAAP